MHPGKMGMLLGIGSSFKQGGEGRGGVGLPFCPAMEKHTPSGMQTFHNYMPKKADIQKSRADLLMISYKKMQANVTNAH